MLKQALLSSLIISLLLTVPSFCLETISADLSAEAQGAKAEALLAKIKSAQSAIKDLQADTTTTITSNISLPGAASKGPQTMTQKGRMWQKGRNKSKVEMTEPKKQTTITNGNIMTIIDPSSGRKIVQDMSKIRGQGPGAKGQGMDATKALDYFDLTVTEHGTIEYIITGRPKEANQFLGRMDFIIDAEKYVPVRIAMYTPKGTLMSLSEMEYAEIEVSTGEAVWVPKKIRSIVTMQMGSVNTEMVYENIKVNQGIKDEIFETE